MRRRTAYVGDSMGVGTSPHLKGKVRSDVVTGRSSASGVDALRSLLQGKRYDQIVFDLGTNDPDKRALKRSLNEALRLAGDATVVVPTVRGPNAREKNKLIRRYARKGRIESVPWAKKSGGRLAGDGIHATPEGYRARAGMISAALRDGTGPSPAPSRRSSSSVPRDALLEYVSRSDDPSALLSLLYAARYSR